MRLSFPAAAAKKKKKEFPCFMELSLRLVR